MRNYTLIFLIAISLVSCVTYTVTPTHSDSITQITTSPSIIPASSTLSTSPSLNPSTAVQLGGSITQLSQGPIRGSSVSPDGTLLVAVSELGIALYNVASLQQEWFYPV